MKRWWVLGSVALLATVASVYHMNASGAHPSPVGVLRVAPYLHDAEAAVSFTFDDGLQCHADKAAPLLSEFGFHGTFFVIAGRMREHKSDALIRDPRLHYGEGAISWDEVRQMHDAGHEIGNHSLTHNFMNHMSAAQLEMEVGLSAQLIAQHIGEAPVSFAYPYNEFNPLAHDIVLEHQLAVREQWTDYGGKNFTPDVANGYVLKAIKQHEWLVPMIHGIDSGFMPYDSNSFRAHLTFLKRHGRDVWVDTYGDVFRYRRERDTAQLERDEADEHSLTFTLNCPLDEKSYDEPLTVIVPLPLSEETDEVTVTRGEEPVAFVRERDEVLIDVKPGEGPVVVKWQ